MDKEVILYGSANCHKTIHYQEFLSDKNVEFDFYDVVKDPEKAKELRSLYKSGKLNFPTIMLKGKKLRNPKDEELEKWLIKKDLIKRPSYANNLNFSCGIDSERHDCGDAIEY